MKFAQLKLISNLPGIFLLVIVAFALGKLGQRPDRKYFILAARALSIFIVAWFIYQFTGFIGRWFLRRQSRLISHILQMRFCMASCILSTRLAYVELTPNNGNWYVPYPPLNAVLMMPMVALWGAENVNSSNFSIFFAALSVSLVFAILEKLSERGWTKLKTSANLWLTVLFGFSTPLWQIAISGEVWYINQVVTIAFVALATLLVLLEASPLLVGLAIGLALLARPPILLSWIFLLGIFWQIQSDRDGRVPFAKWFKWSFLTAIPIILIGLAFLWYNYSRFGSLFDFGYAAMNIGEPARTDIRTYGQFNLRYLSRNLDVMFLRLPHPKTCLWICHSRYGRDESIRGDAGFHLPAGSIQTQSMGQRRVDIVHSAFYSIGFVFHNRHLPIWVSLCFGYDHSADRFTGCFCSEGKTCVARESNDPGGRVGQLLGGMVVLSALVPIIIKYAMKLRRTIKCVSVLMEV